MPTDDHLTEHGDDGLADPLHRALARLGDAAGPPPTFDELTIPSVDTTDRARPQRSGRWALGAAAAVELIVASVLFVWRDDPSADRLATETAPPDAPPATNPGSVEGRTPDSAAIPTPDTTASPTPPAKASSSPGSPGASATVTIEPGQTLAEIRDLVIATGPVTTAEFDAALGRAPMPSALDGLIPSRLVSREGLLGVGNHNVTADADELVAGMVERFDDMATGVGLTDVEIATDGATGTRAVLSPYQLLIVASLVEAETTVDSERPRIARVILNRLAAGELLGIDSALVYGLGRPIETQADLEIDSPYNARRYPGLPPSPIGAPSRASLAAATNPEPGDWLFYVRTDENGPGSHRFTSDLDDFVDAVELCQDRELGCELDMPAGDPGQTSVASQPTPGPVALPVLDVADEVRIGDLDGWLGTYVWLEAGDGNPIEHRLEIDGFETRRPEGWLYQGGDGVFVREAVRLDLIDGHLVVIAKIAGGDASPYDDFEPVFALSGDPGAPTTTLLGLVRRDSTEVHKADLFVRQPG